VAAGVLKYIARDKRTKKKMRKGRYGGVQHVRGDRKDANTVNDDFTEKCVSSPTNRLFQFFLEAGFTRAAISKRINSGEGSC